MLKSTFLKKNLFEKYIIFNFFLIFFKFNFFIGNRSMVDVANFGDLKELMASEPIQELVTKIWYGGLEPEGRLGPLIAAWLLPPIAPFMLPPANVRRQ
jgi:hypothetical protein